MLLRRSTDIYPKELARDMREFFNSLLGKKRRLGASHALAENLVERPDVTVFWGARASPRVVFGLLPKTVFEER
jgi:hypothetical protein